MSTARPKTVRSTKAGAYFCEHVFYAALATASTLKSIACDDRGEPLVGFLHVPGEPDTPGSPDRHAATVAVLREALVRWTQWLPTDARVLITGFGPFLSVTDNPTGALVADVGALISLFDDGASVSEPSGSLCGTVAGHNIALHPRLLDVDATCIDDAGASIQGLMRQTMPHAVLSLGVARRRQDFTVESLATDANFCDHGGVCTADARLQNMALWRALRPTHE